jgi:hypothetical protein
VYFPRLRGTDPLHGNLIAVFAPCGAVAGLYARTDQARRAWHSPAGVGANLLGFQGAAVTLSASETAALDALNVSAIRAQPALAAWGAHTLAPDTVSPQYKYVAGAAACALNRAEPRRGPTLGGVRAEHAGAVGKRELIEQSSLLNLLMPHHDPVPSRSLNQRISPSATADFFNRIDP